MKYTNTGGDLQNLQEICNEKTDILELEEGSEIRKFLESCDNIEDARRKIEFFISYQKCIDELKVSDAGFITAKFVLSSYKVLNLFGLEN